MCGVWSGEIRFFAKRCQYGVRYLSVFYCFFLLGIILWECSMISMGEEEDYRGM